MEGEYPGKPVKGYMERKDMSQTWKGWKVYANPGPGREPVTIIPGHDDPTPPRQGDRREAGDE